MAHYGSQRHIQPLLHRQRPQVPAQQQPAQAQRPRHLQVQVQQQQVLAQPYNLCQPTEHIFKTYQEEWLRPPHSQTIHLRDRISLII